jgi:hypothetical protein
LLRLGISAAWFRPQIEARLHSPSEWGLGSLAPESSGSLRARVGGCVGTSMDFESARLQHRLQIRRASFGFAGAGAKPIGRARPNSRRPHVVAGANFSPCSVGGYDVAVGSRFSRHSVLLNYPFLKIITNRAFHMIARLVLLHRFCDLINNLKLI